MVQRIMNTMEKTSTGVSPPELILTTPSISNNNTHIALSDVMDQKISKQTLLLKVGAKEFPRHSYVLFSLPVGRSDK